jgi:hypothetical protein
MHADEKPYLEGKGFMSVHHLTLIEGWAKNQLLCETP